MSEYRERMREYAEREYDILYAQLRGLLTDREYRDSRTMAYLAYGYIAPARRSMARRLGRA